MKRISLLCCCCALSLTLLATAGLPHDKTLVQIGPASSSTQAMPPPAKHGGKIETAYDGFNHETVVRLNKMKITCGAAKGLQGALQDTCVSIAAALHCPGQQLDYVRYATLRLFFETKDWDRRHPLEARELSVVADGETLRLGKMTLAEQKNSTDQLVEVMREVLEVSVPYQTFHKMAQAQTLEMKVGPTIFELRDKNLAALRDLDNRVKP